MRCDTYCGHQFRSLVELSYKIKARLERRENKTVLQPMRVVSLQILNGIQEPLFKAFAGLMSQKLLPVREA